MAHFAFFFQDGQVALRVVGGRQRGGGRGKVRDEAVKNVTKRPPTHVAQAVMAYTATQHSLVKVAEFSPL